MIQQVEGRTLTRASGTEVLEEVFRTGADPQEIIRERGLAQVSDTGALGGTIDAVLSDPKSQKAVADYRAGKENAIMFLVGQVMKQTRGTANAAVVREMLQQKLA